MDSTHRTAICRICYIVVLFFVSTHKNLSEAATLEFCQVTDHVTNNTTETGFIKSPGFGTRVRDPNGVPSYCTIYITVCPGCRLRLSKVTTVDCASRSACFLRSASVDLNGFPLMRISFNDSSSPLNVTSTGRKVDLVFSKSSSYAVTGQYGFNISYRVMRPKPIEFSFDPNRTSGVISSLGFPNHYSSNEDIFKFHFEPAADVRYYLQLSFSDWYLSKYSKIKIQVDDNSMTYDYLSDRPFVTTFQKPILITFETGFGDKAKNYIGFKATYMYTSDPHENDLPAKVGTDVFDSVFGGKIGFSYSGPGVVDYVWVIPRSNLIKSDETRLKLRIDVATNLSYGELEIRSGPTSESAEVNWTIGNSLFNESGFYLRLRRKVSAGSTIAFNAVFVWTVATDKWESNQCRYGGFRCVHSMECLKSRDLVCDGIRHCDDETDELGCTATSKPCPSYWFCQRSEQLICITRRCDGIRDCLDSADELDCRTSTMLSVHTTTLNPDDFNPYTNYNTLSITLPLIMLGVIIVIIISFIVCIAIRRKRHLSAIRRTLNHTSSPGAWNTDANVNYNAHYIPNSEVISPPPYGEAVLYTNQGFTTSPGLPVPPPYEEIAKPLAPVEPSALPPPYMPVDEAASTQPPHGRTSPRRSDDQRISESTDSLIHGDSQR